MICNSTREHHSPLRYRFLFFVFLLEFASAKDAQQQDASSIGSGRDVEFPSRQTLGRIDESSLVQIEITGVPVATIAVRDAPDTDTQSLTNHSNGQMKLESPDSYSRDRLHVLMMCAVFMLMTLIAGLARLCMHCRGDDRRQRNLWYGTGALLALVASAFGFMPGTLVVMAGGQWFADAFARTNQPSVVDAIERLGGSYFHLLWAHLSMAFVWCFLAALQVLSGALGYKHKTMQAYHRKVGYVAAFAALLAIILGAALEGRKMVYGPHGQGPVTFTFVMASGFMVVANVVGGILYVRAKDIPRHKAAMAWACAWSADPGALRLFSYFLKYALAREAFDTVVIILAIVLVSGFMLALMCSAAAVVRDIRFDMLATNIVVLVTRFVWMIIALLQLQNSIGLRGTIVIILLSTTALVTTLHRFDKSARAADVNKSNLSTKP